MTAQLIRKLIVIAIQSRINTSIGTPFWNGEYSSILCQILEEDTAYKAAYLPSSQFEVDLIEGLSKGSLNAESKLIWGEGIHVHL